MAWVQELTADLVRSVRGSEVLPFCTGRGNHLSVLRADEANLCNLHLAQQGLLLGHIQSVILHYAFKVVRDESVTQIPLPK